MPEFISFEYVPKDMFFDKPAVMLAYDKGRKDAMSKIGAFIMTGARSRTGHRAKKSASPGQPPRRHAGILHDKIYFAANAAYESVVIGALTFDRSDDVPGLLESGGFAMRAKHRFANRSGKVRVIKEMKRVQYHAFPYMGPSLNEAIDNGKLDDAWRYAVKP